MEAKVLGILGGMGPLASLAFVQTIYECNRKGTTEQSYPSLVLHSLSTVPDRTGSLLNDGGRGLEASLIGNLKTLNASGVTKIVICCFTSHTLLGRLPEELTGKIVSLVDLAAQELCERREPSLLLASRGSYERRLFDVTPKALSAKEFVVEPDEKDQRIIHGLIYEQLKPGREVAPVYEAVRRLLDRYGVHSFIAACTEFHLLTRYLEAHRLADQTFVDPLFTIARHWEEIFR